MKKIVLYIVSILVITFSSITCFAAPEIMKDGAIFDAQDYADRYPDLKKAYGYKSEFLYPHYLLYGAQEGRTATYTPASGVTQTDKKNTARTEADEFPGGKFSFKEGNSYDQNNYPIPFQIINKGGYNVYFAMGTDASKNNDCRSQCAAAVSANVGKNVICDGGGIYYWFGNYYYGGANQYGVSGLFFPAYQAGDKWVFAVDAMTRLPK